MDAGGLRQIELLAAIALATDLGTGQPIGHSMRTALLSLRAAEALGASPADRSVVVHTALLRFLGCTSDASDTAVLAGGDEIAFNAAMAPVVMADDREALPHLIRHLGEGLGFARRLGRIGAALSDPGGKSRSLSGHCEAAARLAGRIGLPADVTFALAHAYERWDGRGLPDGLAGDDVPLPVRVAVVARDVDVWCASTGLEETLAMLARRRGRAYDPAVVDAFVAECRAWLDELDTSDPWDVVTDHGASDRPVDDAQLDDALTAWADFADLKSPWFLGHSRAVSALAAEGGSAAGLSPAEVVCVRRAGLVHDLGIVSVPSGVWNTTSSLSAAGWERVRLHSYWTERIIARCPALNDLALVAASHHERSDGSGYHRGSGEIPLAAQIVAVADVYQALTEDRPYRARLAPADAMATLVAERDSGRLWRRATDAVLTAAGHSRAASPATRPAGLTEREVDVLRLIARGRSNKQVATALGISPKTVGSHVEHIYVKAGVTTRAGVTLFAMEHDLLRT